MRKFYEQPEFVQAAEEAINGFLTDNGYQHDYHVKFSSTNVAKAFVVYEDEEGYEDIFVDYVINVEYVRDAVFLHVFTSVRQYGERGAYVGTIKL